MHAPVDFKETIMPYHIRSFTLLLGTALMLASAPLSASSAQTRSVKVHSFDLDLSSKPGQAELERRIHRAVGQVCGSPGVAMDDIMSYKACVRSAQVSAMSQFDVMVRAAHDGKVATDQNRDVIVR
jgi:UrcA family protein